MPLWILFAFLLGLVEALTEFLPVSSSVHLYFCAKFLSLPNEQAEFFAVAVQLGAVLALVQYYWKDLLGFLPYNVSASSMKQYCSLKKKGELSGLYGLLLLCIATLPAVILGVFLQKYLHNIFSMYSMLFFFALGGVCILVVENRLQRRENANSLVFQEFSLKKALWIGFLQCFALFPGFSRSTATIMGGLLCGLQRRNAVKFSFLLALPIITGASFLYLIKHYQQLFLLWPSFVFALLTAFFCSLISVRFFIPFLEKNSCIPFGVYRVLVTFLLLGILLLRKLSL